MPHILYEKILQHENLREDLSKIRSVIKEKSAREELMALAGDGTEIAALLCEEDPKVRKNAALLLGDLKMQSALDPLFAAYMAEQTRFVKSAYLEAIAHLDATDILPELKERLKELENEVPDENEVKHRMEELRALRTIIVSAEGITRHTFKESGDVHRVILTTSRELRNVTEEEIDSSEEVAVSEVGIHPLGVEVKTDDISSLQQLRTYREMLFPLDTGMLRNDPVSAAEAIWEAGIQGIADSLHEGGAPYYFRADIKSQAVLSERAAFAKKFSDKLERISGNALINSPGDYELSIRFVSSKDGRLLPLIKFSSIDESRFSYRKCSYSGSMNPALAASLVRLVRPYLKENAQVLDPFCGVGTLLIEREKLIPAGDKYGIDIFGEAIAGARANASAAGVNINFINRNYFDFKHDYLFDEIVTDFPVSGKMSSAELDNLYASFFRKSKELLYPGAVVIIYSNEEGRIKKQLRLNPEFMLVSQSCIRKKDGFNLFLITYKNNR